ARLEKETGPPWNCQCSHTNPSSSTHCQKCSLLRKEEREMRQQVRSIQGLGRGGGYMERDETVVRKEDPVGDVVLGGLDIYGRRRTTTANSSSSTAESPAAAASSGPRNSLDAVSTLPTKADRQKAALDRLRAPKKKTSLSPARTRVYREKSSRSRSREKRREQVSWRS
ncbi:unnamed protein product, partial [Polarella glacialis]